MIGIGDRDQTLSALAVLFILIGLVRPATACDPCQVGQGTYLAREPDAWDRHAPLSLLVFVHGYRSSAAAVIADPAVAAVARAAGFLLIAPDGVGGTWSHVGSPAQGRDERAFFQAVMADVDRRWPIDHRMRVLSGFSQGGSMVWEIADRVPLRGVTAVPVAGSPCGSG